MNEGMNNPLVDKAHPWGPSSPLRENFTPRGQFGNLVKTGLGTFT
jgi:hypothetical protein